MALAFRVLKRKKGRIVVFTNGCFDILHAGHVKFLQEARRQGDLLVVEKTGARFCNTDIVRTRDRAGQFYTGNIFLSDFIPYKKVAAGS